MCTRTSLVQGERYRGKTGSGESSRTGRRWWRLRSGVALVRFANGSYGRMRERGVEDDSKVHGKHYSVKGGDFTR